MTSFFRPQKRVPVVATVNPTSDELSAEVTAAEVRALDGKDRVRVKHLQTMLIIAVLVVSIVGVASTFNAATAVKSLRTSAARVECRARVVNEDTDTYRHRVSLLFDAVDRKDSATAEKVIAAVRDAEPTQHRIDRLCPRPLVNSKPKVTP